MLASNLLEIVQDMSMHHGSLPTIHSTESLG